MANSMFTSVVWGWVFGFVDTCGFQFIKDFTIKEPLVFGGKNRLVLKNYRFQLFHKVIKLPKSRWSPPLCASMALKISKNGLEVRKLWPSDLKCGFQFYRIFLIKQLIAYFQTPEKIFKYYFIAFKVTR
jgi:hypothetical protein